ncbi:MAG: adenylate/guanylate cyclase domain-containing protein [Rhizobium sp.]|nr:adenylate/guanylate cyclase domain-containing protein [Rhizobium sp.]MBX9459586.1 adenylate/guanylate cyclase domain-containing protein [Rhizobium sp.]
MISTVVKSRVHIISGLVLAVFLASHFANHALGIVSVSLMERGRGIFNILWRSSPGTVLLYGALLAHFLLALDALWRRGSLRMPVAEALKIGFGLALPLLLAEHVIATRLEYTMTGFVRGYPEVLRAINVSSGKVALYAAVLVIAWAHGCLGIWFWLRGRAWFQRFAPVFHMMAVVVPLLALTGMFSGLRWAAAMPATANDVAPLALSTIYAIINFFYLGFAMLVVSIVLLKFLPNKTRIRIRYPGGRVVAVDPGTSVLEASRSAGIPHVSVCGGRGRCSTCRVRVIEGMEGQPEAESRERATLKSISAAPDVRLACQLRPTRDLTVAPLVDAGSVPRIVRPAQDSAAGQERLVAALFCDLRGFTELSERKLPYDVVFLLNRYFATVGRAVEDAGGVVDKYIGDGAIALFGLETSFPVACRQALMAAVKLGEGIEELNAAFQSELQTPLRIAIGLHAGPAVVGQMGHGKVSSLTAIGDTINTASRLEGLAKARNVQLAVSADLVKLAGVSIPEHTSEAIEIRGREAKLETWIVSRVSDIAEAVRVPESVKATA